MKPKHEEQIRSLTAEIAAAEAETQRLMEERDAIYLKARTEGAKYKEIAEAAGCRPEAIRQRLRLLEKRRGLPAGVLG